MPQQMSIERLQPFPGRPVNRRAFESIGTTLCADQETSTFWEAAVDQEHVVCSSLQWGSFTANDHRDHVVHAVVLTSMGSDSDKI